MSGAHQELTCAALHVGRDVLQLLLPFREFRETFGSACTGVLTAIVVPRVDGDHPVITVWIPHLIVTSTPMLNPTIPNAKWGLCLLSHDDPSLQTTPGGVPLPLPIRKPVPFPPPELRQLP